MIGAVAAILGGRGVAILAGALAAIALLVGVYQTGVSAERKRGEAASLRQTITAMERQQQAALDIQTRMATATADLRAQNETLRKQADDIEASFRAAPVRACSFSDADRLRLQSIRIGPARANRAAR